MIATIVLAAGSAFIDAFAGIWRCGNAHYHERWEIKADPASPPGAFIARVIYGDPAKPDGFATVYYVPGAHEYRYDDFHADGAQSHLTSPGSFTGVFEWTGVYYPNNAPADPNPDITWKLTDRDTIVRTFAQKVDGKPIVRGSDECVKASPSQ